MTSKESKCLNCGAWGVGVVQANGLCGYCNSQQNDAAPVNLGRKRKHHEIAGGETRKTDYAIHDGELPSRDLTKEEIARILESAADAPQLDDNGAKRMLLALEKCISRNQMARVKYAGEPARFMESEVELHEELKKLSSLSAAPETYHNVVSTGTLTSLLGLLTHENSDIACQTVNLLGELLEIEDGDEGEGETRDAYVSLAEAIIKEGGVELLLANLRRLDASGSPEDRDGIYASFSLVDSLISLVPDIVPLLCPASITPDSFPALLLQRIGQKTFEDVKLYASELLAVLLQKSSVDCVAAVGAAKYPARIKSGQRMVDGVEFMCECLNVYKKSNPDSLEEQECLQNMFDVLCALLLHPDNQQRFSAVEGVQLMLSTVSYAGFARVGALRALSFALAGNAACCEVFVDAGGLKEVFPAFMGKSEAHTRKLHGAEAVADEQHYATTIIAHLLQMLEYPHPSASIQSLAAQKQHGKGLSRIRVLGKFKEAAHEKVDRVVELFRLFQRRIQQANDSADDDDEFDTSGLDGDALVKLQEYEAELKYSRRRRNGLNTLQQLSLIAAYVITDVYVQQKEAYTIGVIVEPSQQAMLDDVSFAMRSKLYEQGISIVLLGDVIAEFVAHITESDVTDSVERLEKLLGFVAEASGVAELTDSTAAAPSSAAAADADITSM